MFLPDWGHGRASKLVGLVPSSHPPHFPLGTLGCQGARLVVSVVRLAGIYGPANRLGCSSRAPASQTRPLLVLLFAPRFPVLTMSLGAVGVCGGARWLRSWWAWLFLLVVRRLRLDLIWSGCGRGRGLKNYGK